MTNKLDIKVLCLLSIQRAMLGSVILKMCQGWLQIDNKKVVVTFVVDDILSEDEQDIISSIETELMSDLPSEYSIELDITQKFRPLNKEALFFLRHEN